MLEKDVAAENGAITLYQKILTQDFDDYTKKRIEEVLRAEQQHRHMFSELLTEISS